jgi:hypothetical protein
VQDKPQPRSLNLGDLARMAVTRRSPRLAGRLVDFCRYVLKMDYEETYSFVNQLQPIDRASWDNLLFYADTYGD